jgi:ribosome biogenesis SPOUT family RNA methylase Rps3
MRNLAGPGAEVHFTHLSKTSSDSLNNSVKSEESSGGKAPAFFHMQGLVDMMKERGIPLEKVCLLDPKAEKVLAPEDGDGGFDWFLFGVSIRAY